MCSKIFRSIVTILLLCLLVIGCTPGKSSTETGSGKKDSSSTEAKGEVLKVGTMPVTVGTPVNYAIEQGWFKEAGLNVEMILFPTGAPINEALAAEQIDVGVSGLASVYAVAAGDSTWVGEINNAMGLGIYVRPDSPILKDKGLIKDFPNIYGSAETIKKLEILGPLGTAAQFNAIGWAKVFGLTGNDFKMLHMEYGPATQAFISGEGDAIAASPPYTYQLEKEGMVMVASLEDAVGFSLMDGIIVRNKVIKSRRDDIQTFLEVIYKAQEVLGNDDKVVYDVCFDFYNSNGREYTEEMMNREIKERDFIDKDIINTPNYRFAAVLLGMGKFYVEDGKIEAENFKNIEAGIDPSFLEEIYDIDIAVYENK